ncbi:MAG: hypothetical protein ACKVPX_01340 [Myxococcaceae bacterium]
MSFPGGFTGLLFALGLALAGCLDAQGTEVGVVSEGAFFVRTLDEDKFPFFIRGPEGLVEQCQILTGQASQDVTCYLEMMEGDVHFQPLTLRYNVPSQMCEYFEFRNYHYYNFEVGHGASSIVILKDVNLLGDVVSATCTADGVDCSMSREAFVNVQTETATCAFDYSPDLPNCCFGRYAMSVTTRADTDGNPGTPPVVTTSSSLRDWGGALEACLSGPAATDAAWPRTVLGRPIAKLWDVNDKGINGGYRIEAPINISGYPGTFHTANFFTDGLHNHSGLVTPGRISRLPYALDPIDDRSGTDISGTYFGAPTQDAYEFRCLDKAYEVINRIRVYVREWNTKAEFEAFGASAGAAGNPDVVGRESVDCEYELDLSGCNDGADWDDLVPVGGYSLGGVAGRPGYFPSEPRRAGSGAGGG